jgi:hypothetical protein
VQTELINTIDKFTNETNFDILAFATDLHPWKKRSCRPTSGIATPRRPSSATCSRSAAPSRRTSPRRSGRLGEPRGRQDEHAEGAALRAFGVDPEKPSRGPITAVDKATFKSPLDTVYFLSDGRPSVGKLIEANEIRKEVRRYNEIFRLVLHTIAIGDFQKEFLKQLAEENGGVYVDLGR